MHLAKIAGIERQLDLDSWSFPPAQFAQFGTVVFQPLQLDAVMKDDALRGHSEHDIKFAGAHWQWRRQSRHFTMPAMCRCVLDAPMGRFQIHIDNPLVEHLAECAEQNDSVLAGIIVIAFEDIAECGSGVAVY